VSKIGRYVRPSATPDPIHRAQRDQKKKSSAADKDSKDSLLRGTSQEFAASAENRRRVKRRMLAAPGAYMRTTHRKLCSTRRDLLYERTAVL